MKATRGNRISCDLVTRLQLIPAVSVISDPSKDTQRAFFVTKIKSNRINLLWGRTKKNVCSFKLDKKKINVAVAVTVPTINWYWTKYLDNRPHSLVKEKQEQKSPIANWLPDLMMLKTGNSTSRIQPSQLFKDHIHPPPFFAVTESL